jgi:hypothetical protein
MGMTIESAGAGIVFNSSVPLGLSDVLLLNFTRFMGL